MNSFIRLTSFNCHFFVVTFIVIVAAPLPARAGLIIDQDLIYYNGSLGSSSNQSSSVLLGGISIGASIPKSYQVGWNVNYVSHTDVTSAGTAKLTGTEMGPRFTLFLGKTQHFSISVTYHALANSTYVSAAGSSESWQGTGFQGEIAFLPQISNTLFAGFKVIYDTVSYSKSTNSSNTTSSVSYSHTLLVPTISLSWRF